MGQGPDRGLGGVALGVQLGQVGVGGGDRGGQGQPRHRGGGAGGLGGGGGGGQGRTVLAPEVQVVAQAEVGQAGVVPALRDIGGREAVVVALLGQAGLGVGGDLRGQGRAGLLGQGVGPRHPGGGLGEVGAGGQGLVDQGVQLGVAVAGPPAVLRPVGGRGLQAGLDGVAGGRLRLGPGAEVGNRRACGEGDGGRRHQHPRQEPPRTCL